MPVARDGKPCVRCWLVLALIAVVVLAATGVWNPFPDLWQWASQSRALSDPKPLWQQRLGGTPRSVTIAGEALVVEQRTTVEARNLGTGVQLWERKADWAAVAGDGRDAVVAVGKLLVKGYQVLDPTTGAVRRRDDAAVAVWGYRNALLDARCVNSTDCTLTAWDPRGTTPLWSTPLPGIGTGLLADSPRMLATRRLTARQVQPDASGPELMPGLLGLPIDGRVLVVETATGRVVQDVQPAEEARLSVAGGRLLRIEAVSRDGTCYFTVVAREPITGQEVWRRTGVNLRTADGAGCVQRQDPQGGQNVLVGVAPDGRETVLDGYDGRLLWVGEPGQRLVSVDDRYALARAADGRSLDARELDAPQPRWTRPVGTSAAAALTRYAVVLVEQRPDRLFALDRRTGRELVTVHSSAKVYAVGPAGMVIGDGRDIGYLSFGGTPADPGGDPDRPGTGPGAPPAPGRSCGGPKNEVCTDPD
jgi:outer membrane protein assembly factor BamB